jgi:hypothetical protein
MDLAFAVVLSCEETGCFVHYLDAPDTRVWTRYSDAVQDEIRVRRRQLVVVDRATEPPQIVWRWIRAEVLEVRAGRAVVGAFGICDELAPRNPDMKLEKGDAVWVGSNGKEKLIQDAVQSGGPAHPDELAAAAFPAIEAWYAGAAT